MTRTARHRSWSTFALAFTASLAVLAGCDYEGPCEKVFEHLTLEVKFVDDGGHRLPTQDFLARLPAATATVCLTADGDPDCDTVESSQTLVSEDVSSFELSVYPRPFEDRRECRLETIRVTIDAPDCDTATFDLPGGVATSFESLEKTMLVACHPRAS